MTEAERAWEVDPREVLARLAALRGLDAPTHGGHLLAYVYDPALPELDELAAEAVAMTLPVNGLDPTTFRSAAAIERDLVTFARSTFHGGEDVVGTVTSGGTESCLLAVLTARQAWRARHPGAGRPRLVVPTTAHAAFHKAAHLFDLELDQVPVEVSTGVVAAAAMADRFDDDVALAVVSAPSYPHGALDPVAEVAAAGAAAGVDVHVDACIGGFALAFWPEEAMGAPGTAWDFAADGVVSLSADLHKYAYAPKGASVLLQRGRDRQRGQFFATRSWPGYPVVNPTLLGSRSATSMAAAWAIVTALGAGGLERLTASVARSLAELVAAVGAIEGLRVVGAPCGPLLAAAADAEVDAARRVDPHHWADAVARRGFVLQTQPGYAQSDGSYLPPTVHLTLTPVTESVLGDLVPAMVAAADEVRGVARVDPAAAVGALLGGAGAPASVTSDDAAGPLALTADDAAALLRRAGLLSVDALRESPGLGESAPLLALVEGLPEPLVRTLLVEVLARTTQP